MLRACPLLLLLAATAPAQDPLRYWAPANRDAHAAYENALVGFVDAKALRAYHDLLASGPHRAGSEGDMKVASRIAGHFRKMGLEVEMQELWLYLAHPVSAKVEVVAPETIDLALREEPLDRFSGRSDLSIGWNAFSATGDVTAGVVYANYGRKQDYEQLDKLGVSCRGRIVIARYGGNFRGYKAKFAEARGAAGLIIYTDPADSGWGKGLMYPEGGYANGSSIQRGSIVTLPYRGDPLTPGMPATKNAKRLKLSQVALPKIPVQPMGWDAAEEILKRMKGASVPKGWQGGLAFRYRLTGGDKLKVRLSVEQERKLTRTFNVTGTLRGATSPDEFMVVGSHHDAWGFGAGDPLAGTILVLEAARCFAEAARNGQAPARSIVFAAWAAEEYGLMGSVEWVEQHRKRLSENCIAYLNLDMAAMGPNVRSASAPLLKTVMNGAIEAETGKPLKRFGDLGGGSDHVGFYCHLGIPSASLGAGGSKGVSYHSHYDNLAWYRRIVGDDYKPAVKLTRIVNRVLARVCNADVLPLDPGHYGPDFVRHLGENEALAKLRKRAESRGDEIAGAYAGVLGALEAGKLGAKQLGAINKELRTVERLWLGEGLPDRPFYRSMFAAPDEHSGYAAWMLPGLRAARAREDDALLGTMVKRYESILASLGLASARLKLEVINAAR
ncbi:MAG: M28 family peptidase [Planctomycetota bacterium]|jgi:N-acetylated-alpha-linked acidic dipeptidase